MHMMMLGFHIRVWRDFDKSIQTKLHGLPRTIDIIQCFYCSSSISFYEPMTWCWQVINAIKQFILLALACWPSVSKKKKKKKNAIKHEYICEDTYLLCCMYSFNKDTTSRKLCQKEL